MRKSRQGEVLALLLSLLESWFPILSLFAVGYVGALNAYFWIVFFATAALAIILGLKEGYGGLVRPGAQRDLLLTSFFITTLFLLVFLGLQHTTAGNVAVILTLQLLFSYLYFNVIGGETLRPLHTAGAFMMGTGAVIMLLPERFSLNEGDLLVLAAAAIAPLANLYQKRARRHVSAVTILTYRNLVALPFLFAAAWLVEGIAPVDALVPALPYLVATALLIYVLAKILWIEALHRIGITKLSAMISFMPLFTLLFAYAALGEVPTPRELLGIVPVLLGAYFITRPERSSRLR